MCGCRCVCVCVCVGCVGMCVEGVDVGVSVSACI